MTQEIYCAGCSKLMGVLRDAKIRNGMVVYCITCDDDNRMLLKLAHGTKEPHTSSPDMPDFMKDLFGGYTKGTKYKP